MYILDTNAIIYYLHGDEEVRRFIDSSIANATPLYASVVTETELLRYSKLGFEEERAILNFLPGFSIIPMDSFLARKAGALRATASS